MVHKIEVTKNKLKNSPQEHHIHITRILHAPLDWAWKSWVDPDIIEEWYAPTGHYSKYDQMEFREGGKYFLRTHKHEGPERWVTGIYEEIVPHKKIVFTLSFADKNGNIILGHDIGLDGQWPEVLYVTVEFEVINHNQTKIVVKHEGIPKESLQDFHEDWHETLDKFQEVVERYGDENLNQIQ